MPALRTRGPGPLEAGAAGAVDGIILGVGLAVGVIAAALCFRWELRQLRSRSAAGE
ncbi:hypothetical protein [Rothia kristinae]|uniref:hypothetical protein n=1 Tax=Rothia kristinae TaxID=37923 RepID=UPI001643C573|nr:hypothetical protein [Rothia kristinae]MDN5640141.1 hypothetical protein [Actinomycetes bacterium]